ncbi:MAG: GDP-mannose 4,6-dehydratase, partial [Synergistaceae bacterium]|nr:GDP-mannose 4,6-dehydratase [Synergistaceae bacterium]
MKIIVTGGAGFIGSNFIFYMLAQHPDYKIICVDKLTYAGNINTLKSLIAENKIEFFKLDICDRERIYNLFERERPDIVVNFAAESHVDRSIDNPGIFLFTNTLGTGVLLDACVRFGVGRFHQ